MKKKKKYWLPKNMKINNNGAHSFSESMEIMDKPLPFGEDPIGLRGAGWVPFTYPGK